MARKKPGAKKASGSKPRSRPRKPRTAPNPAAQAEVPPAANVARFDRNKSNRDGLHYFNLVKPDGRVSVKSEGYHNRADCEHAIKRVSEYGPGAVSVEMGAGEIPQGQPYLKWGERSGRWSFNLHAPNHEVIATGAKSCMSRDEIVGEIADFRAAAASAK